jgi:hypothetical protein
MDGRSACLTSLFLVFALACGESDTPDAGDGRRADGSPAFLDSGGAPRCGDGVVQAEAGESCDLGDGNSDDLMAACSTDCEENLVGWFDAADLTAGLADGAEVGAWTNRAGTGDALQLTSGRLPTFRLEGIAEQPAIELDGDDDVMIAPIDLNPDLRPEITIIAVYQNAAGDPSDFSGVWGHDDGGFDRFLAAGGSATSAGISNGSGLVESPALDVDDAPLLVTATLRDGVAGGSSVHLDGEQVLMFDEDHQGMLGTRELAIGNVAAGDAPNPGGAFDGRIAALLVFARALPDAEREAVEAMLRPRTVPPVDPPPAPTVVIGEVSAVRADVEVTFVGETDGVEVGVVYGEAPTPTTEDEALVTPVFMGGAMSNLNQLRPLTRYYARAYARNTGGTTYGPEVSFDTTFLEEDDAYAGGQVAEVDEDHALIYKTDQIARAFGCADTAIDLPDGGNGRDRTDAILRDCAPGSANAAEYCAGLPPSGGVPRWFLPNEREAVRVRSDARESRLFFERDVWLADSSNTTRARVLGSDGMLRTAERTLDFVGVVCVGYYERRSFGIPTGIGPQSSVDVADAIAGGTGVSCSMATCMDGHVALGGGGDYPIGREQVTAITDAGNISLFRRCVVARGDDPQMTTGRLRVSCADVPGAAVTVRVRDFTPGDASIRDYDAGCQPGEELIGGGATTTPDFDIVASRPVALGSTRQLAWRVRGEGTGSPSLSVAAVCAAGVTRPLLIERRVTLEPGSQCASIECPEGTQRLAGGGNWGEPWTLSSGIEPGSSAHGDARSWTVCGTNRGPGRQTLTMSLLCSPMDP